MLEDIEKCGHSALNIQWQVLLNVVNKYSEMCPGIRGVRRNILWWMLSKKKKVWLVTWSFFKFLITRNSFFFSRPYVKFVGRSLKILYMLKLEKDAWLYNLYRLQGFCFAHLLLCFIHAMLLYSQGAVKMAGHLLSRGVRVQRFRVRASLKRVKPIQSALRWGLVTRRRKYSVAGV